MAEARRLDADLRIEGPVPRGDRRALGDRREAIDQEGRVAVVKLCQRVDGLCRVVEALRFKGWRRGNIEGC